MNYSLLKTHKDWEEYLKNLLRTNDYALKKSIVKIYNRQTEEEKLYGRSNEDNKIGFNRYDSEDMSKFARILLDKRDLTDEQLQLARHTMPKYWKQLMQLSKEKQERIHPKPEQIEFQLKKYTWSDVRDVAKKYDYGPEQLIELMEDEEKKYLGER